MDQFKIQEINGCTRYQKMLKNSVNNFSDNLNKIEYPRNLVWVSIKNDNQPRNIQHQQKEKPRFIADLNYEVSCEVQGDEKPVEDKNVS